MDKDTRILFFGDSIMAQDGRVYEYPSEYNHGELGKVCRGYPTLLKEALGDFSMKNYAVGGQGISQQKELILQTDFSGVSLVMIAVGVNDFSQGVPVGKIPSSLEKEHDRTFIGDYCTALDHIFASNPRVKVILMTPLHRNTLNRTSPGPKNTIDTRVCGNSLFDYAQAIRDIGEFYSCPVADLFRDSGLNRLNLPVFTFEGVHPTNEGYRFIFPVLLETVRKVMPFME